MQNRFKVTPQIFKEIKAAELLLGTFKRKDKNGNLMFRAVGCKENVRPLNVNHQVNLIEVYKKDGQKGMDAYIKFFTDLKNDSI